jgi:para-nitrobenzyl esterase
METQTGQGHTYRYYFTRVPPGRAGARLGAFHGEELAYVFENFPFRLFYVDVDKQLGEAISSYWVNFAKTGDPNRAGLPPGLSTIGREMTRWSAATRLKCSSV